MLSRLKCETGDVAWVLAGVRLYHSTRIDDRPTLDLVGDRADGPTLSLKGLFGGSAKGKGTWKKEKPHGCS